MPTTELQTKRIEERDVLRLLAMCLSNREIAERLKTNVEAVAAVKAKAMKRLGLKGRIDIIRYVERQGWEGESNAARQKVYY